METYECRVVEGWALGPDGQAVGGVAPEVATDSQARVYVTRRHLPAIVVYDRDGRFVTLWGDNVLSSPHGLWIDNNDRIFCTDIDDHTVRIFSTQGDVLMTLGKPHQAGAPDMPFNMPTKAMATSMGDIIVTDGYGQHRVHCFSAYGNLIHSWGSPGSGPSQFTLPHDVWVDRHGRVLVVDRENHRIQLFDLDGRFLEQSTNLERPQVIHIDRQDRVFVIEVPHRVSVFNLKGELLARWGEQAMRPGNSRNTRMASVATGMTTSTSLKCRTGRVACENSRELAVWPELVRAGW